MRIVPRAEVDRRWREHRIRQVKLRRETEASQVEGLDLVTRLFDGRKVEFRGRHYGVPPIPWKLGLRVFAAEQLRNELIAKREKATLAEWGKVYREVTLLFNRLTRPTDGNPIRRLLWRWWPSGARGARIDELVRLLVFFWLCGLQDGGATPEMIREVVRPGTSPSISRASSATSPRGATRKATRARGSTS